MYCNKKETRLQRRRFYGVCLIKNLVLIFLWIHSRLKQTQEKGKSNPFSSLFSLSLSFHFSQFFSFSPSLSLSFFISLSNSLSHSIFLSFYLFLSLSNFLPLSFFISLSIYLSLFLFISLSFQLSLSLSRILVKTFMIYNIFAIYMTVCVGKRAFCDFYK